MRTYPDLGLQIGNVLLPNPAIDLKKWAVIACDQFTSQPEYWQEVENLVGEAPSTYHLVLPEAYLEASDEAMRIQSIQANMRAYLDQGIFKRCDHLILVERQSGGRKRHGLMLALDLERYDFTKGATSLIRATEGTILERIPPRVRIREGAQLELPHILVLIDDPQRQVIEPLVQRESSLERLYDTDLMQGSGHISAFAISNQADEDAVIAGLRSLADPAAFHSHYGVDPSQGVLLFAMGDGNHSLATAKTIWEQIKSQVGMDHPARYALVEIENIHDEGLVFEPIHRIVFGAEEELGAALQRYFGSTFRLESCSLENMLARIKHPVQGEQFAGCVSPQGAAILYFNRPTSNLPVGTLQPFLDTLPKERIDYVHGEEIVTRLGSQKGNIGFFLPGMAKEDLFKTVILDGVLPRKTFSMGEAADKRFYLEARQIA